MPSLKELRDQKQRESFTGRQIELNTFRRLLTAGEADYAILHIYGVGGIGKSSLLRQYRRIARQQGCPVAIVDMQVHFSVDEILRSIREQMGQEHERAFADFDKSLDMFNDVKSKLQGAVGSLASGVVSGLREGVPLGIGALAVDTIGEEQMKAWLYRHLPRANADLYLHGDRVLTEQLITGLNRLAEQANTKLVLMFDTYEQSSQAQDDWLRDTLIDSELTSQVMVVIAGRDPLAGRWHEWRSILLTRQLHRFTEEEAREYLGRRGINDPLAVENLLSLTERLPWALALIADIFEVRDVSADDFENSSYRHLIGEKLVNRFISQVQDDPEMREMVEVCAVLRTFDHDVVRAVWQKASVDEAMRRLRHYSFVQVRADGRWSLNQVVREFLDHDLRRRSQRLWTELNQRAAAFYQENAGNCPHYSREWNWLTLESLYHRLRLDEDQGILFFASLFEEAKHLSRYDFCSELLSNIKDVPLQHSYNRHWLRFYEGVLARVTDTLAWDQAHALNLALYQQPNLPQALRARVTTDLGRYYYQIADQYALAIDMLNESLQIRRDLGDQQGQAHVLSHRAVAQSAGQDFEQGRASAQACIDLAQTLNAPFRLGWGYFSLGMVERRAGNHTSALEAFQQSLETFDSAGYEFEPGVVHYRMGGLLKEMDKLDQALRHYQISLELMQKYDKEVLAARTMVDLCELYLAMGNFARLDAQAGQLEATLVSQDSQAQLARLRLVQAQALLRQLTAAPEAGQPERGEQIARASDYFLDAVLATARTSRLRLQYVIEQIEAYLGQMEREGHVALAQAVRQSLIGGVEQVLESTLARRGQLIVLDEDAQGVLKETRLRERWILPASEGED